MVARAAAGASGSRCDALTIVAISGARGPYASNLNGIYDPHGADSFFFAAAPVYKKRGEHFEEDHGEPDEGDDDDQAWLYLAQDNTWWVSGPEPMEEQSAAGWLCTTDPVEDPTLPPFRAAPDPGMWSVYLGDGDFEHQPTLRIEGIDAAEAARRHHVRCLFSRVAALEEAQAGGKGCCIVS